MEKIAAEAIGTMLLVLLGDGVVANVLLARSKGQNSGWIVITMGWGVAVAIAVYAVGRISGAHLNPAVTRRARQHRQLSLGRRARLHRGASRRRLRRGPCWSGCCICRTGGDADPGRQARCSATGPGNPKLCRQRRHRDHRYRRAGVRRSGDRRECADVVRPGDIDLSVRVHRGPPAAARRRARPRHRTLARRTDRLRDQPGARPRPRLAHAVLPIAGKGDSDWELRVDSHRRTAVGGVVGAALFRAVGF